MKTAAELHREALARLDAAQQALDRRDYAAFKEETARFLEVRTAYIRASAGELPQPATRH